jgi:hypothetical protein
MLSKKFYRKSSIENSITDLDDISKEVKEDENYYYVFSNDEKVLLELSNQLLASR